jgi:phosphohistidine swiveling domain-containing protein
MTGRITSMDFGDEPSLGPSAPGWPPVQWHRHSSHGARVRGLVPGAPHKQPAAYARKVLLNRHLLERPSPDGLPRQASGVIAAGTARWSHPYRPCPRRALANGYEQSPAVNDGSLRSVLTWRSASEQTPSSRVQHAGASVLQGIAASPGRYTGPVRMVLDEFGFGKLRPGDVLVCPITSPVWSVLFPTIGALVTDTGGILSHPAIIAREHRVPAAVATGNATGLLHDDQVVTVDGTSGQVEVIR